MVVSSASTDVVRIGTYLDVRNVGHVRVALNRAIAVAEGDVVVDMDGLEVIDAAGLGMLTAAHLRAQRAGTQLILRNCSKEVRRVLAVTRLNRLLHLERRLELSA